MKKWFKRIVPALVLLYFVAAGIVMPYLVRTQVPPLVSKALGAPFTIDRVSFNPFIFRLTAEGIRLQTPGREPLFSLRRFDVNLNPTMLVAGRIALERITLDGPRVTLVQERNGTFNFDWLTRLGPEANETAAAPESAASDRAMPRITLKRLELTDGHIAFSDFSRAVPLHLNIEPLGLSLADIDTAAVGEEGSVHLYAVTGAGSLINLYAKLRAIDPLALQGTFDYEAGQLYNAWHFLQDVSALEVADGKMHLHLSYDVNLSDLNATRIDDIRLGLKRLRIKPKAENGDIFRLGSLNVAGGPVRPLQRFARIGTVSLDDIFVALVHREDGSVNWQHYFPAAESNMTAVEENAAPPAPPAVWDALIDTFDLRRLAVQIDDEAMRPATHFSLDEFNLTARHISALPKTPLSYDTALRFNGAFRCAADGNVTHTPLDAEVLLRCSGLDLTWFNPYIDRAAAQSLETFDIALRRATLGFAASAEAVDANGSVAVTLSDANATLARLRVTPKRSQKSVLAFDALTIEGVRVSTASRKARVASVVLRRADIAAVREKDGGIDLAGLVKPKAAVKEVPSTSKEKEASKWSAVIDRVTVADARAALNDRALLKPTTTTVEHFNLTLRDVTTDPAQAVGIDNRFSVNGRGTVSVKGSLVQKPLRVKADLHIGKLALTPFSPYVEDKTYARLDDGRIRMSGRIAYAPSKKAPDLTVRGDFYLDDLLVTDSRNDMPLVSMTALNAKKYLFQLHPDRFFVDTVELNSFYADIVIDKNKTLNLASIMRDSGADANATAAADRPEDNASAAKPFPVRIVRFIVNDGAVHFADYSLPLQFDTQIHDVNGQVLGISTLPDDTTYLRIDGEIDRYGVAKAEGSLNTGDPKAFTDIGVEFRNIDMSSFTPYSGVFVGRAIDKGKLAVTLRYNIVHAKMKGDNSLVIRQIKLGREIESNESVSLPLDFAIALLEDDDGVIDIDMPVEGDVDNPDFKWGGVVWNAFVNLMTKAVTAPFDLIGSMLGISGDELKYIEFEPGKAVLDAASRERLDLLAKALKKRPKLGVTVTGTYDETRDTKALKTAALLDEVLKRGGKEQIDASAALAPGLLEPIYIGRFGEAKLAALKEAAAKAEKEEEVQRRYKAALIAALIESQPLPEDALSALARQREQIIRSYLMISHAIDSGRIVGKPPKAVSAEGDYVPTELGLDAGKE